MRITGGRAKGIVLRIPKGKGIRPATDRLREATFSCLGESVAGKRVVDLFAGSGAYGLEAISRGASRASFVERDGRCLNAIRMNLEAAKRSMNEPDIQCQVFASDVFKWCRAESEKYDLVFLDPPYDLIKRTHIELIRLVAKRASLHSEARIVIEMPGDLDLHTPGWALERRLGKGKGPDDPTVAVYSLVD